MDQGPAVLVEDSEPADETSRKKEKTKDASIASEVIPEAEDNQATRAKEEDAAKKNDPNAIVPISATT